MSSYSNRCSSQGTDDLISQLALAAAKVGAVVGGLGVGTVVGFVVGALHRGENWSNARLDGVSGTAPAPERQGAHTPDITVVPRRDGLTLCARVAF